MVPKSSFDTGNDSTRTDRGVDNQTEFAHLTLGKTSRQYQNRIMLYGL